MIYLYVQAPFAAFRTFAAGWYRPTATFMTHSAAYGLLLNLAGVESRLREEQEGHDGKTPASLTRFELPSCQIALGVPCGQDRNGAFPKLQSVYQQLHNYPVGSTGKDRAEECRGNKYNITPVRREFLSGLKVIIAIRATGNFNLESDVLSGLSQGSASPRYGLPFLGDNSFLPDRIEPVSSPSLISWYDDQDGPTRIQCQEVSWYERIGAESTKAEPRAARLTLQIDRADMSKTRSDLFAPGVPKSADISPPEKAWVAIESMAAPKPEKKRRK